MLISSACLQFALWAPLSLAAQLPVSQPQTTSTTLVDALSADPDYTSLLRLFQRARLIPTLNSLNGTTLFAPTNDAIKLHSTRNMLWLAALDGATALTDNIQEQLRQQLFYHLLNESLHSLPSPGTVPFYKTLLYPRKLLDPPSHQPPPYPPWMPVPNGTLGCEPQRLRLAAHADKVHVAVDTFGKGGGAIVVKGLKNAGNGILIGVDKIIEPPADLATILSKQASVSYFQKIMTPEIVDRLNSSSQLTLFFPVDAGWSLLHPVERLYLESKFATDDLHSILDMHTVVNDGVIWSDSFDSGLNLTSIHGSRLKVVSNTTGVKIGDADLIQPDIYASNGVIHLVSSLLLPAGALQLTPQKYLMALNCTKFVSLLNSVNLTHFINDTSSQSTILAPKDDIIAIFDDPAFPPAGSAELKRLLQYHFIPGNWTPSRLKHGTLLRTSLKEPGLNYKSQVLPVEINSGNKEAEKSIRFGGASIIGEPIVVNNTIIYFVSRPLVPPPDPFQAALPMLNFSSYLAALFSTSKAEPLRTAPSTTFLIPENEAFRRLGLLVSAHLLAPSSKEDLGNVLTHHVLTSVQYADSLRNGSQHTFATLEGSDLTMERLPNGTTLTSSSGGWTGFKGKLQPRDVLTQTGVIHETSDILIPRSVQITIGKLVKAAKGSTMATLVNKAGFDWILNGTAPPDGTDGRFDEAAWTLLCPTDEAFKRYNLTQLLSDIPALQAIVAQHLIPTPSGRNFLEASISNNQPLVLQGATYSTVHSADSEFGDLVFEQRADTHEYVVGIKGARGATDKQDWARVTAWGRSTTGPGTGGVIQIDRLLIPYQPSWWVSFGAPISTGFVGVILISLCFYGVRAIWRRDVTEATYEPIGGFGRDDSDEQ